MNASSFRIRQAAIVLLEGGVVACPTEAVWGLSCDPDDEAAVMQLLRLKRRPPHKGLILVAASMDQFGALLDGLTRAQLSKLEKTWPGPATWLVPHGGKVSGWISGNHDSVALRVSAHPVVRELCLTFGGPLVSTSANRAGAREAVEIHQVWRYFGADIDYIVPGRVGSSKRPTTIKDLQSGKVIRSG